VATGSFLLQLSGEIDLSRAAALELDSADFLASCARHAVIDLSEVTFCDSQGLNFLVRMEAIARAREGDVTLVNTPGPVRNLLRITSLQDRFRYEERVFLPRQLPRLIPVTRDADKRSSLTLGPA